MRIRNISLDQRKNTKYPQTSPWATGNPATYTRSIRYADKSHGYRESRKGFDIDCVGKLLFLIRWWRFGRRRKDGSGISKIHWWRKIRKGVVSDNTLFGQLKENSTIIAGTKANVKLSAEAKLSFRNDSFLIKNNKI